MWKLNEIEEITTSDDHTRFCNDKEQDLGKQEESTELIFASFSTNSCLKSTSTIQISTFETQAIDLTKRKLRIGSSATGMVFINSN